MRCSHSSRYCHADEGIYGSLVSDAAQPTRRSRRSSVVRTVYRVMARDGVHRVPLQQIADEAGVSKALLLYHFESKDAMVLEALNWVLEATADRIRSRIEEANPGDLLGAVIDAIWIDPVANHDFFRFYLDGVEHQARSPGFEEFSERGRQVIDEMYADVIRQGVADSVMLVTSPAEAAIQMRAVIEGTFLQWLQRPDWMDCHGEYKQLCLRTLSAVLGTTKSTRC